MFIRNIKYVQINLKNLHYMLKKRSSIVKPFVGQ